MTLHSATFLICPVKGTVDRTLFFGCSERDSWVPLADEKPVFSSALSKAALKRAEKKKHEDVLLRMSLNTVGWEENCNSRH